MDTSALVAALVADHQYHSLARPHLRADGRLPAIVLAETFSQLRRTFGQSAANSAALLRPWWADRKRILPTTAAATAAILRRAGELDLGGSIHDALVAQVCKEHDIPLVTLDGRQHRLALALGAGSTYLLA
ncbi:PIN domain-containing protein [Sporichthya sp.]|uniref:type II toxin-antitoxin system VapC family toxin n=1 Tax=Sporichthya sp. TaxID=65475 RepID=UPI0017B71A97|nr:PIN domain-containing protein [Sporichthya sp.]MBA3741804.1 PIN domain-containing protein [Sporichthya sp.]